VYSPPPRSEKDNQFGDGNGIGVRCQVPDIRIEPDT
jgi:hypothetical protein